VKKAPGRQARATNLRALSAHLRIDVEFLEQVSAHGETLPDPRAASPAELARLRRLQRLCRALDLDVFAGAIIVELLERAESLARELEDRRSGARDSD